MGPRKGSQSLSVLLELPTVVLTQGEKRPEGSEGTVQQSMRAVQGKNIPGRENRKCRGLEAKGQLQQQGSLVFLGS